MSKPKSTRYRTTNWPSYNAALKARGSLTVWFDPSMNWEDLPTARRGHQPDFRTLNRRQKSLPVDIPYRSSNGLLHLLIDSTGIKVEGEGEWHTRKHEASEHRISHKLHIAVDEGSLEIRAVEIMKNDVGDAPVLPVLLEQIPDEEDVASVTADGAFDTRRSHEKPLPAAAPRLSYLLEKTQSHGVPHQQEPSPETKLYGPVDILDGLSGDGGAVIIDEAASRRRCTASNCWANV